MNFSEAPCCLIGLSRISGEGLFAGKVFMGAEVVVDCSRSFRVWPQRSYITLMGTVKDTHYFVGESEFHFRIISNNSLFGKVNHSRTPNTLWVPENKILIAIRDIKMGDEITYDYRLEIGPKWLKDKPPVWC